jgi:predicted transcriptional regulator
MARHSREDPKNEAKHARAMRKTSMYLSTDASKILDQLANEGGTSRNNIINTAIIFYAVRGSYMEALVKRSVREALQEFRLVATPHRVLLKRARPC